MAIANAVLDVIEKENLRENATKVGDYMLNCLKKLKDEYLIIGDVRGAGLFFGVELVDDRDTKKPAAMVAGWVVRRFREEGIIMSTEGKYDNVLKFKPPMQFNMQDAKFWLKTFQVILEEYETSYCNKEKIHGRCSSCSSCDSLLSDSSTESEQSSSYSA